MCPRTGISVIMAPESNTAGMDGPLMFLSEAALQTGLVTPKTVAEIETSGTPNLATSMGDWIANDTRGSKILDLSYPPRISEPLATVADTADQKLVFYLQRYFSKGSLLTTVVEIQAKRPTVDGALIEQCVQEIGILVSECLIWTKLSRVQTKTQ